MKRHDFSPGFQDIVYPCYSVRLMKSKDELHVLRDNKCIQKFKISSFPEQLDFNKVETIFELLKIIKKDGGAGLMTSFPDIKAANSIEDTTDPT